MTLIPDRPEKERAVTLLSRAGCRACSVALAQLEMLGGQVPFTLVVVDVDRAAEGEGVAVAGWDGQELRAEFGDRVPVVLLDGEEHSYWEVDVEGLRAALTQT